MSYAPYPAYKDSGVPWLGNIPEHWDWAKLYLLSKRYAGGTPDKNVPEYWEDGTIPWQNSGSVNQFKIDTPSAFITEEAYKNSSAKWVPEGALLMALAGQGKTKGMVAQTTFDTTCNQSMAAIVWKKANPRFMLWWLNSQYLNIRGLASSDARDGLNLEMLARIPCPLPSEEEQTAIAGFLDKKTAEIDDLIAKKEELLRLLAEQRTALITHAVTKGLDPAAPIKPSGIDWLGDVPKGWDVVPFKWCCQVQSGQVDPKLDEYKSLPLIAPDHIESGTGRLLPYESAEEQGAISGKYQFAAGEVLYSKIRPELSKVALAPEAGLCSADMYAIRALDGLRPEFLFYQMLSRHFHRFAVLESMRVAMPKINRESLGVFPVMVPDENTQAKILDHIQSELAKMDLAEEKITTARDYLKEYRSAVITNAVTGKIKVA